MKYLTRLGNHMTSLLSFISMGLHQECHRKEQKSHLNSAPVIVLCSLVISMNRTVSDSLNFTSSQVPKKTLHFVTHKQVAFQTRICYPQKELNVGSASMKSKQSFSISTLVRFLKQPGGVLLGRYSDLYSKTFHPAKWQKLILLCASKLQQSQKSSAGTEQLYL